ncbi:MAG: dihydroorotate dehydrogenase [Solirubrobacteraceae bacterium]
MSVAFCGLELAHRVLNGSGTWDAIAAREVFGEGFALPFAAFVSKTITVEPRPGNPPHRLWETPAGMINSIGLPNRGLAGYLEHDLPRLAKILGSSAPLITNVMGSSADQFAALLEGLAGRPEIAAFELNVSCPNVKTGLDIGAHPAELGRLVARVRSLTPKPLIVKLTPNTADVPAVARAAEAAGADALSLINTLRALPDGRRGWLGGGTGGLSGPAIRPIALAQVAAVAESVSLPVIGMGGIASGADAREFLDAGATLVAVGTESFRDPAAGTRVAAELETISPQIAG